MHNNLKKLRNSKNFTQKHISSKLAIPCRSYQRYEQGEQIPNVYIAIKISKFLNTTVEELFPLSDETDRK